MTETSPEIPDAATVTAPKPAWQAPTLVEIEYQETLASAGGGFFDGVTYTSSTP